jgi:hypothetical protein
MNLLSMSSGMVVLSLAVNLKITLSLSTYLKKFFFGGFGSSLYT